MVTPTGCAHIYLNVDGLWVYAGAPMPNELETTIKQYQRQYGTKNVRISNSPNKESTNNPWKFTRQQIHANIRSAIKHTINVESNWAYRSKTMLRGSKWRKKRVLKNIRMI